MNYQEQVDKFNCDFDKLPGDLENLSFQEGFNIKISKDDLKKAFKKRIKLWKNLMSENSDGKNGERIKKIITFDTKTFLLVADNKSASSEITTIFIEDFLGIKKSNPLFRKLKKTVFLLSN